MSTHLSTLLQDGVRKRAQTLLTHERRERQLISTNTNQAHQAQEIQLTLNQQVPSSSPGRRTKFVFCSPSIHAHGFQRSQHRATLYDYLVVRIGQQIIC
jgi:hypothetical protein